MSAALEGLDDIDWDALSHAYGSAADVPELLRALADPARADDAMGRLDAALFHQGGVIYPAALAAIPFLVRLLDQPAQRFSLTELLTLFATEITILPDSSGADRCRAILRDASARLLTLLDEPDPIVRAAAVHLAVALPIDRADIARALRQRYARETDASVRVGLVLSIGEAATAEDLEWLNRLATDIDEPLRFAAAAATPAIDRDALVDLAVRATPHRAIYQEWTGPNLISRALRPSADDIAYQVGQIHRLGTNPNADLRADILAEAGHLVLRSRTATVDLTPTFVAALDDTEPRIRRMAIDLLAGIAPADHADRMADVLADPDKQTANWAVFALARSGDARCLPRLRAMASGDDTTFPFGGSHYSFDRYWFGCRPGLQELLLPMRVHASELVEPLRVRLRRDDTSPAHHGVTAALTAYGPAAAPAVPELTRLLTTSNAMLACQTLAAIGPTAMAATKALINLGRQGSLADSAAAAWALWHVTGTAEPALDLLGRLLHSPDAGAAKAARWLADLGPLAQAHAATLRTLATPGKYLDPTQVNAAHAYWRITGDAEPAAAVFVRAAEQLRDHDGHYLVATAIADAAAIGTAIGTAAVPILRAALNRDSRLTREDGWRGIATDEALRAQVAEAIQSAAG